MGRKLMICSVIVAVFVGYSMIDRFNPDSVKGKRVLVTGASTGIGEQLAYHYARLGARLVITARRENVLKKVVEKCKELGGRDGKFSYVAADMSSVDDTKRVVDVAIERMGGLDYLVLNHITDSCLGFWEGTPNNFTTLQKIFDINFNSYVYLASHAKQQLEQASGSIIVVSSLAGKMPQPQVGTYSASKFALEGFFGALRQEFVLRKVNVSVTLCVIGLIATDTALTTLKDFGKSEAFFNIVKPADPSDTALAILKGGALRQRQMYYPYWSAMIVTQLRELFPYPAEYLTNYLAKL